VSRETRGGTLSNRTLSNEKRLIKDLLDSYAKVGIVGRPVRNTSDTVTVHFGLALIQILDLDEKNQILNTNVWSRYVSAVILMLESHILDEYDDQCFTYTLRRIGVIEV